MNPKQSLCHIFPADHHQDDYPNAARLRRRGVPEGGHQIREGVFSQIGGHQNRSQKTIVLIGGPQYRPRTTTVLIMGTPSTGEFYTSLLGSASHFPRKSLC